MSNNNFLDLIQNLNHSISFEVAKAMTQRMEGKRNELNNCLKNDHAVPISETFNSDAIRIIIDQPNAVAFRAYLGLDDENKLSLMFVGVNQNGEDIINTNGLVKDNPSIADTGQRFP